LEIVGAFAGSEGVEETAYAPPEAIDGALFGFSEKCLEFCEDLLDRIEVRRVVTFDQSTILIANARASKDKLLEFSRLAQYRSH
jgi:hypothetical protein